MYFVEDIPINADTIVKAYKKYYSLQFENPSYKLLNLFGIRVSTSNVAQPDDFLGAIRLNSGYTTLDYYDFVICRASTEASPVWVSKPFDSEARRKGGTAFLREGQHLYEYISPKNSPSSWSDGSRTCSFCPITPRPVYRWLPTQVEINAYRKGASISANFERDLIASRKLNFKNSRVKLSDSTDTCIHRAWNLPFTNDSAGCQVIHPNDVATSFRTICSWAKQHIDKKYPNTFVYTLFTKEQFLAANRTKKLGLGIFGL
jgi:hypothetical protein